jgi:hypothetical protein
LPPIELSSTGKAAFDQQELFHLSSRQALFSFDPLFLPNELWRQQQVWREWQPASGGGPLWQVQNLHANLPELWKDVFAEYRFAGESIRLLAKLE